MQEEITGHYGSSERLAAKISEGLKSAGLDVRNLRTTNLATVDEFHIRGRAATLELAEKMNLGPEARVLDIGSGLGGPARTLAETYTCHVTGIDLTQAFCEAAQVMSEWVRLGDRVTFAQGDATDLPYDDASFDAAMTIHVAMNIPEKDKVYSEARRVLKPGGIFAVYDVLQGEGGEVMFPVPWAREPSISHLATPDEMRSLLAGAGFEILEIEDSTKESQKWFEGMVERMATSDPPPVTFQTFLGGDFPEMARNQVRNLTERRIRTVSYICRA